MSADELIVIAGMGGIGRGLLERYKDKCYVSARSHAEVDVTDHHSICRWVDYLKDTLNHTPQITLVNCTGITDKDFVHKSDPPKWEQVIRVNLVGSYNLIRAFLPWMREANYGRIILLSSVVVKHPVFGSSAYASSKAGLWGLSRTVALENARNGITCNCINLGYTEVGMIDTVPKKDEVIGALPLKRCATIEEVGNTIDFLRNTGYVTGTEIDLQGGL